ncbi:MAG: hypothetical protein J2P41_17995 [Blastocatellia bacterium]|nr:hypothetical protein [Blastocatellia bacterium]
MSGIVRHPFDNLVRHWNWKAAVMSALFRGILFFVTTAGAGLKAALSAMTIESAFYISTAGFYGAITQAFRRAHPAWAAMLTVMFLQPIINHSLEFTLHWIGGTEKLARSIVASICFSILSAVFNLFAMKRGALIVGEERQSLFADLRRMPSIIFDFIIVIPRWLVKLIW